MQLQAQLTAGWPDDPQHSLAADRLHTEAAAAAAAAANTGAYQSYLARALEQADEPCHIQGLDQLFRKRTDGSGPFSQFVGALAALSVAEAKPLVCRIDAFAYAFLKYAKNIDFVLPLDRPASADFFRMKQSWDFTIAALTEFERVGQVLPAEATVRAESYLALRHIIARPSARDELRALAILLLSGPSTLQDIRIDLGLKHSLVQRTFATFGKVDVIERRSGNRFAISTAALPLVVFCLRETIGLDLLQALAEGD